MAKCPKCRCSFKVMEDECPEDHGCPKCGFGTKPEDEEDEYCIECGNFLDECICEEDEEVEVVTYVWDI